MSILTPIDGAPGMFRDPNTGGVVNLKGLKPWEKAYPFGGLGRTSNAEHGALVLREWAIYFQKPPQHIPPSIIAKLEVGMQEEAQAPLFRIARCMGGMDDLLQRVERLEKAAGIDAKLVASGVFTQSIFVPTRALVSVFLEGDRGDIDNLIELNAHLFLKGLS